MKCSSSVPRADNNGFKKKKKKLQYFIRWKGYSPLHDSWVNKLEMHPSNLIKEFYSDHPTMIRASDIKEPLFLSEDNSTSPFQFPLSSVTTSSCSSPPRAAAYLIQLFSPLEPLMEESLFNFTPLTTTCTYVPPLLVKRSLTPGSYGPTSNQMPTTLRLITRQQRSLCRLQSDIYFLIRTNNRAYGRRPFSSTLLAHPSTFLRVSHHCCPADRISNTL